MKRYTKEITSLILAALVVSIACTPTQITASLDAVIIAAEIALPMIPGLSPSVASEVKSYLGQASGAVSCVTTEMSSGDNAAVQALKYAACFTRLDYAGLSPQGRAIVQAVDQAVQSFLQSYGPAPATKKLRSVKGPLPTGSVSKVVEHNNAFRARLESTPSLTTSHPTVK